MSLTNLLNSNKTLKFAGHEKKLTEIKANKIPQLETSSLKYFNKLIDNDLRLLEFEDELKIFSLNGTEIGIFKISVVPYIFRGMNCFKIKAKSYGILDDIPCGTEINAIVNEKLETLEQDHYEYIKFSKNNLERKSIITLEDDSEYLITQIENNQNEIKRETYTVKKSLMVGFITESSNILLQRLMIQYNLYEPFSLFTFDSELNPCLVNYKPLDTRIVKIEHQELRVKGIERTIESVSDIPTTWQIYFSSDGHMVNRVQVGYPAIMKVISKPNPIEIDEFMPEMTIEKKEIDIDTDMQLKSNYLDRKDELKNEYDQYLHDHPEFRNLMTDYMQSILCFKPDDVLSFTTKFFAKYSSKTSSNRLLPLLDQQINIPKH